jgi:hypothetical protein
MHRLNLITIVVVGIAALTVAGAALAAAGAAPVDLYNNNASGDDHPLVEDATYRASLFPLAITVRPTDALWRGSQWVEKNGLVDGSQRTGGTYAYVALHHTYGHNPSGKISSWGLGLMTIEIGVTPTQSVQATMQRLRARLDEVNAGAVRTVRVAGFSGLSYDGRLKDGAGASHRFVPFSSSDGSKASTDSYKIEANYGKGGAFRVDVIDVYGKTVVIYFDSFTAPAAKFPVFLGFADKILSTMRLARA